jgi:predicted enzyme related to lactoylglutathione lyase
VTLLDDVLRDVQDAGGSTVVPLLAVPGAGRAAYVTDPAGVLLGLHEYDPEA